MAGKIIADTLEHSTAGSVTTDYVVDGTIKCWLSGTAGAGQYRFSDMSQALLTLLLVNFKPTYTV